MPDDVPQRRGLEIADIGSRLGHGGLGFFVADRLPVDLYKRTEAKNGLKVLPL